MNISQTIRLLSGPKVNPNLQQPARQDTSFVHPVLLRIIPFVAPLDALGGAVAVAVAAAAAVVHGYVAGAVDEHAGAGAVDVRRHWRFRTHRAQTRLARAVL